MWGGVQERDGGGGGEGVKQEEPVAMKASGRGAGWGVVWIEGGPMDEIGLAEKSPPETSVGGKGEGGGERNCQSRQGNKRSEKWNWWEGFGDWYSCWVLIDRAREWNKTGLFCFHPALVERLEDCI